MVVTAALIASAIASRIASGVALAIVIHSKSFRPVAMLTVLNGQRFFAGVGWRRGNALVEIFGPTIAAEIAGEFVRYDSNLVLVELLPIVLDAHQDQDLRHVPHLRTRKKVVCSRRIA